MFSLIETRDPTTVMISIIVAMSLGHGMMFAAESAYFPELFPTSSRYSGASFGFQVAAALGGGLAPIIATLLSTSMGGSTGVSVLLIGFALITLTAALTARETQDIELEDGQG